MYSLSDADKLNEVASFNQRCRTPSQVQRGANGDDETLQVEEDGDANHPVSMEASEVPAVVQEALNPQEQPAESTPYLDPKSRKKRGNRMKELIMKETPNLCEPPRPTKEGVTHKGVGLSPCVDEGQPKKYRFQCLNFAKIMEYFYGNMDLQADEEQWYTSVGLKPDSGSTSVLIPCSQLQRHSRISSCLEHSSFL